MPVDANDADFVDNLQRLLGLDTKAVEALIPKIKPTVLIDLADAVTHGDKRRVLAMIKLGREDPVPVAETRRRKPYADAMVDEAGPATLSVGDAVRVNGKDATIRLARGPGNTVGVMLDGRIEMVERTDVTKVDEGVLGMSAVPNLRRMQELAGIATGGVTAGLSGVEPYEDEAAVSVAPLQLSGAGGGEGSTALGMLEQLATLLPNLRLAEIKTVRKKMNDLICQINESAGGDDLNRAEQDFYTRYHKAKAAAKDDTPAARDRRKETEVHDRILGHQYPNVPKRNVMQRRPDDEVKRVHPASLIDLSADDKPRR